RIPSASRIRFEPPDERRRAPPVARDDENRVVAGDRADRFGELRAIDRERERLRLPDAGSDDDQLLNALGAPQEFGARPFERRARRLRVRRIDARALIGAVARALDEPKRLDVAR